MPNIDLIVQIYLWASSTFPSEDGVYPFNHLHPTTTIELDEIGVHMANIFIKD